MFRGDNTQLRKDTTSDRNIRRNESEKMSEFWIFMTGLAGVVLFGLFILHELVALVKIWWRKK